MGGKKKLPPKLLTTEIKVLKPSGCNIAAHTSIVMKKYCTTSFNDFKRIQYNTFKKKKIILTILKGDQILVSKAKEPSGTICGRAMMLVNSAFYSTVSSSHAT